MSSTKKARISPTVSVLNPFWGSGDWVCYCLSHVGATCASTVAPSSPGSFLKSRAGGYHHEGRCTCSISTLHRQYSVQPANQVINSELALVTSNGRPLVNYADLTTARKAGATGFLAREKTQERMEQLSRHMSHQPATNIRYYRLANRRQEAVATHAIITEVTASCKL